MAPVIHSWYVNAVPAPAGEGVVALTATELSAAAGRSALVLGFHDVMCQPVPRANGHVELVVPEYRGKRFIAALAWLVAERLGRPGATAVWHLHKQQGPDSIRRLLGAMGWRLERTSKGRSSLLTGPVPEAVDPVEPQAFTAKVGDWPLRFAADYGVFSPTGIDAGTRLLLDVALRGPSVPTVADIGTGYGPLAIGLVRNGIAGRAVATDIDCVALWLARRNATANEADLTTLCSADPTGVEATELTVCNVPTHISAEKSAELMTGLLRRARAGRLLIVVHASLEQRYTRYFTREGVTPGRHGGSDHVVLDSGG